MRQSVFVSESSIHTKWWKESGLQCLTDLAYSPGSDIYQLCALE